VSKSESKRIKKRAEPSAQPVGNDLLSVAPEPQAHARVSKKAALPSGVDEASFALSVALEEKPFLAEATAASAASNQKPHQEEMNQKNSSEAEQKTPTITLSAGDFLKAAREASGFSIDDVSRLLKLAPRQIQALEQQNFTDLPPRTFVRGFIRNYARLLNIDADAVLEALPPEGPQAISPAASSVKMATRAMPVLPPYGEKTIQPQTWKWLLAVTLLAIIAIVFFFWPQLTALLPERHAEQTENDTAMSVTIDDFKPLSALQETENSRSFTPIITPLSDASSDSTISPIISTPASIDSPAATEHEEVELVLRFIGDSWAEVRDKNDKVLYSTLAKAGSEKTLLGVPPFSLVLGNSKSVTVILRGEPVDLGGPGRQSVARLTLE
jgi:cytoskeleton protein RodZ